MPQEIPEIQEKITGCKKIDYLSKYINSSVPESFTSA